MSRSRLLFALACLVTMGPLAMAQSPLRGQSSPVASVSSSAFPELTYEPLIVDVREEAEWRQTGVPRGAATISVSRPDFVEAVIARVGGDRSRPVAVICRSGTRSLRAADQLAAAGFTRVVNISDGMMGRGADGVGWIAAGRPIAAWTAPSQPARAQR